MILAAPAAAQMTRHLDFDLLVGGDAKGVDGDDSPHPHLSLGRLDLSPPVLGTVLSPEPEALIRQIDGSSLPLAVPGTRLQTGYYRFGLGLGTAQPVGWAGLSWFSYAGLAAEIVRSGLVGADAGEGGPIAAAVGGGHQLVTPRLSLYTGLSHEAAAGLSEFVALTGNASPRSSMLGGHGPASLGALIGINFRF